MSEQYTTISYRLQQKLIVEEIRRIMTVKSVAEMTACWFQLILSQFSLFFSYKVQDMS